MSGPKLLSLGLTVIVSMMVSVLTVGAAHAQRINLPADPPTPTDYAECSSLQKRYLQISQQLHQQAQAYWDRWWAAEKVRYKSGEPYAEKARELSEQGGRVSKLGGEAYGRCVDRVREAKARVAEEQRQREAQQRRYQQMQSEQQAVLDRQRQAIEQAQADAKKQAFDLQNQMQSARSSFNTAKQAITKPGETIINSIMDKFLQRARGPAAPSFGANDTPEKQQYSWVHKSMTDLGSSALTNPVAKSFFKSAMAELKEHNGWLLDQLDRVGTDMKQFNVENTGSGYSSPTFSPMGPLPGGGGSYSGDGSYSRSERLAPPVDVDLGGADPIAQFASAVDSAEWEQQVANYQTRVSQNMSRATGRIERGLDRIERVQEVEMAEIQRQYEAAHTQSNVIGGNGDGTFVDGRDRGDLPQSGGRNLVPTGDCESRRRQAREQADDYEETLGLIRGQEASYRESYVTEQVDEWLSTLTDSIRLHKAYAEQSCSNILSQTW